MYVLNLFITFTFDCSLILLQKFTASFKNSDLHSDCNVPLDLSTNMCGRSGKDFFVISIKGSDLLAKTLQQISYPMCQQRMHGKQTFKNNSQSVMMPWKKMSCSPNQRIVS